MSKYIVHKTADIRAALSSDEISRLAHLLAKVDAYRLKNGKRLRHYIVISDSADEYAGLCEKYDVEPPEASESTAPPAAEGE